MPYLPTPNAWVDLGPGDDAVDDYGRLHGYGYAAAAAEDDDDDDDSLSGGSSDSSSSYEIDHHRHRPFSGRPYRSLREVIFESISHCQASASVDADDDDEIMEETAPRSTPRRADRGELRWRPSAAAGVVLEQQLRLTLAVLAAGVLAPAVLAGVWMHGLLSLALDLILAAVVFLMAHTYSIHCQRRGGDDDADHDGGGAPP